MVQPTKSVPATAETGDSFVRDILQTLAHVVVFLCLRAFVFSVGSLGEDAYWSPVLLLSLGWRFLSNPLYYSVPVAVWLLRRRVFVAWDAVPFARQLQWFATGLALMLAATFGGQEFNLFFNQEYLIDRSVLLVLAILVAVRPFFVLPFVILAVCLGGQFCFPMSEHAWDVHLLGIYRLPVHLLLIILCGFVFESKARVPGFNSTILLTMVVVASGYWVPGITKLRMGWVTLPSVHYSLFGGWCHGWLSFIDAPQIADMTNRLRPFAVSLQCATVLFECGALFILCRRVALILLPVWVLFHVGALALYGYAFWMWILIDLSVFLLVLKRPVCLQSFKWQHFLIALVLIGVSSRWLNPNRLAWFNAPLCNTYHFVAVGDSGARYALTPQFFAPYDYVFTMNWFEYVSTQRQVTGPYGTTMNGRFSAMSGSQLANTQIERGNKAADPILTAELTRFLQEYLRNWNTRRSNSASMFQQLKPPVLLNTTLKPVKIPLQERIESVEIVRVRTVLLDATVDREQVEVCLTVAVPVALP